MTREEFAEQRGGEASWDVHAHVGVPGAETPEDVAERIVPALGEVLAALEDGQTAVVVSHGACLRIAVAGVLDLPARGRRRTGHPRQLRLGGARGQPVRAAPPGVVQPHGGRLSPSQGGSPRFASGWPIG